MVRQAQGHLRNSQTLVSISNLKRMAGRYWIKTKIDK